MRLGIFTKAGESLVGSAVLFSLTCGIPLLATFSVVSFLGGYLSVSWFIWLTLICIAAGAIGGLFCWFFIFKAMRQKKIEADRLRFNKQ
jgi:hypothetical protein